MIRVGVISDTHNLVRPAAKQALAGVARILHAGDICGPAVLDELNTIAPVDAVRGNNDKGAWAAALQPNRVIEIDGVLIYILHDVNELDLDPVAARFKVIIAGHSHRPAIQDKDGVLFVNPGSAGPRRFKLPISLATLEIANSGVRAQLHRLDE